MIRSEVLQELHKALRLLKETRHTTIVGHRKADGDAIGSVAALFHWLSRRADSVLPLLFEPLPPRYAFLDFERHLRVFDPEDASLRKVILESDLVVALDLALEERLPGWSDLLSGFQGTILCIDHHPRPPSPMGHVNVIDPDSSSTGELLYELFRLDGEDLSRDIALALFVAISTDTGWFKYANTRPDVLAMAAHLLRKGIDPSKIYGYIYQCNALGEVRLTGKLLKDVNVELGGRFLWSAISKDNLGDFKLEDFANDDLLDMLRSVEKCRCVALFRETPDGNISVNLRSKGDLFINGVAERFGGGGHPTAAGITLSGIDLDKASDEIVRAIIEHMTGEKGGKDG